MRKQVKKKSVSVSPKAPAGLTASVKKPEKLYSATIPPRDPRLPAAGSMLTRIYKGKKLEVQVLENGFEYQGKIFKSISRLAMEIVHRPISGYVFFKLK